ncbi:MAG: PBP1A family penicillin-binding protein [Sporolactobacillus sp.]|nr:PBP1A family penicillin-binding protein [Sporolactobacillus sp.]
MVEYHSRMEKRQAKEMSRQDAQRKRRRGASGGRKKSGWFKRILTIFLLLILFLILAGAVTVFAIIHNAPALSANALRNPVPSVFYDQDNKKATSVGSGEHRVYTKIDDIPMMVQDAFISTEDVRFYRHIGIDPIRIMGAGVAQFTKGYKSEGASTITQQVVRNAMLTQNKTFTRKIQEMYLAIQLEKKYTKKQILEMYLNQIYLGGGPTYGVGAAANRYFGISLKKITLPEAATLAAMTRNPGYYDPIKYPERTKVRRDLVLDLMVKNKAITKTQADQAKAVTMAQMTKNHRSTPIENRKYGAFVDYVRKEVLSDKSLGISEKDFTSGGLKIYTTLDPSVQDRTQRILNNSGNYPGVQRNFQAAVTVLDTQTGAIRALGGGRNYHYGNLNYAYQEKNGVGSTAKPLVDYGPAIEYLKWPTNYRTEDVKTAYTGGKSVSDWDNKYMGSMTIRRALYLSRNVPAVRTLQAVDRSTGGTETVRNFGKKLGFDWPAPSRTGGFNETYAIGSFSATTTQMAGAYAAFGNSGIYNQPYAVRKIVKPDGEVINLEHNRHLAMHDYTAYMITDMLKDVVTKGTGTAANISGASLAGKTGTTNIDDQYAAQHGISPAGQEHGAIDAWFVGYTSRLTAAVWTGYDTNPKNYKGYKKNDPQYGSYLGSNEQRFSQLTFKSIMSRFMINNPDFTRPDSVVSLGGGELGVRNSSVNSHYTDDSTDGSASSSSSSSSSSSQSSSSSSASSSSASSSSSSSESPPASSSSGPPSSGGNSGQSNNGGGSSRSSIPSRSSNSSSSSSVKQSTSGSTGTRKNNSAVQSASSQ